MNNSSEVIIVSIQCLVYNHEKYLRQCLDGFVMQQTNFRYEVIVHDDASTDNSANIIFEYATKYPDIIKPIIEQENLYSKKDGSLRRIMNNACKGKYIAFCEGDDFWTDPYKLQKQVDFLDSNADYSMCFHQAKILSETSIHIGIHCESIKDSDYSANMLYPNWIVPTASIMIRNSVLKYKLKRPNRIVNGDIVVILSAAHLGKVRGMSDCMSVYRANNKSVTKKHEYTIDRLRRLPAHGIFLKENFPLIEPKEYNHCIANSYWDRSYIQESFILNILDKLLSIYYSPTSFYLRLKAYIRKWK